MRRLIFCDLDGVLNGNSEFRKQYIPKNPQTSMTGSNGIKPGY